MEGKLSLSIKQNIAKKKKKQERNKLLDTNTQASVKACFPASVDHHYSNDTFKYPVALLLGWPVRVNNLFSVNITFLQSQGGFLVIVKVLDLETT